MKKLFMAGMALLFSSQAVAFDLMGPIKKYALPCAATAGASFLLMKEHKGELAAVGCTFMVIGGELVKHDPVSEEKLEKMDQLFSYKIQESEKALKKSFEDHIAIVDAKVNNEELRTRQLVQNMMTDLAVLMEAEVYRKVQARLKELEFVPGLKQEMIEKIKAEVIAEVKSRKGEIEDSVVEKVIKRITAEPITVEVQKTDSKKDQQK